MKSEELQRKLLAAARANPPSDRVPYAFEKRITALIASHPLPDSAALWARALWRAAVPCLAVMLLLGAWTILPARTDSASTANEDLSQNFEQTLFAAAELNEEAQ
ncbi:MAG: hypothetical protein EPO07_08645 [Verrucomicrobia bacterium]|nr:MAG: hypothetical protein EPO07_08645 [Verrucomicrobiota bacterium]